MQDIRQKATELWEEKYAAISEGTFRASRGWCCRFMRRHRLSFRRPTAVGQGLPTNCGLLSKIFISECRETMKKNGKGAAFLLASDSQTLNVFYCILSK